MYGSDRHIVLSFNSDTSKTRGTANVVCTVGDSAKQNQNNFFFGKIPAHTNPETLQTKRECPQMQDISGKKI